MVALAEHEGAPGSVDLSGEADPLRATTCESTVGRLSEHHAYGLPIVTLALRLQFEMERPTEQQSYQIALAPGRGPGEALLELAPGRVPGDSELLRRFPGRQAAAEQHGEAGLGGG